LFPQASETEMGKLVNVFGLPNNGPNPIGNMPFFSLWVWSSHTSKDIYTITWCYIDNRDDRSG